MKKIVLVFLVMLGLMSLLGIMVLAAPPSQPIEVTIDLSIHVVIAPGTVSFGNVLPDTVNNPAVEDVSFDATGSNVDVEVEVTTVSGEPFHTGLKFDGVTAETESYILPCVLSGELCTYVLETVDTTLDVPLAFEKGSKSGTITYTITESVV